MVNSIGRDVIKMTITRAKGEGNGHALSHRGNRIPFHTIPFVSCFISLIEKRNMNFYWKFTSKFGIIFVLQSLLGSLFLALRTTLALMRRCVRSQELCARTMTMEDAYQVKITLQSRAPNVDSNSLTYFWFYCTAYAALCATHIGFMCIMTQNGRLTHGPWNSWGTISWSWNGTAAEIRTGDLMVKSPWSYPLSHNSSYVIIFILYVRDINTYVRDNYHLRTY